MLIKSSRNKSNHSIRKASKQQWRQRRLHIQRMAKRGVAWAAREIMDNHMVDVVRKERKVTVSLILGIHESNANSNDAIEAAPFLAGPPFDIPAGPPECWEDYSKAQENTLGKGYLLGGSGTSMSCCRIGTSFSNVSFSSFVLRSTDHCGGSYTHRATE
jgi:hypothetical protein